MSFLENIVKYFAGDIRTAVISLIIGYVIYRLSRFYVNVWHLPPGPIPLPILGNALFFWGTKEHCCTEMEVIVEKYGPVFTLWMGTFPLVFITDIDVAREAFHKIDFAGRPDQVFGDLLSYGKNKDIVTSDYGKYWEALRRVAHSAVKKYSTSDKLVYLVNDCVDHTIETIIEKEGLDKPFDPNDYIYYTFLNIITASAFGKSYEMDDPEYKSMKYLMRDIYNDVYQRLVYWDMFPILRKIDKKFLKLKSIFEKNIELLKVKFESHYEDYEESVVRDFCDTLIAAKNDALREGKESARYLTNENLTLAILDLFVAGTDTSTSTFRWILLYLTLLPEMQQKMRQEIDSQIGDRLPTHEDKNRCHYVLAFISETLRIRNITPNGANHKAIVDSQIAGYNIPKDTQVVVFQSNILLNEKYWQNSVQFRPERFLEEGKYVTTRPKAFIPFGVGRRSCLGEKLAIADLFLVLVRFLQKTSEYQIVLHFDGDTKPDPNISLEIHPKQYNISFKKR